MPNSLNRTTARISTAVSAGLFLLRTSLNGKLKPAELADIALTTQAIRPAQIRSEFVRFAEIVGDLRPRVAVEIGTFLGGSLFVICRLSEPDALIVSIDLPDGRFGGGYGRYRPALFRSFTQRKQRLELIRGDSHSQEVLSQLEATLRGSPIDLLFIDGDHTYEGAKRDFDLYSPLVRKGGVIALHDISPGHPEGDVGVPRLWDEIKSAHKHEELIEGPNQGGYGFGILYT
jgi:predicted O-methyltransferase YrrM